MSNLMQSYNRPEESAEYYLDYGPWAGFFKGGPVGEAWARKMAAEKGAAVADKTAVRQPYGKEPLYWENPKDETKLPKDVPFESLLQKEAIRRQKEAEPQSGHVEPQLFPIPSAMSGAFQTGRIMKDDLVKLFSKMLKK